MSDNVRQTLAAIALFGGFGLIWFVFGFRAIGLAGLGMTIFYVTLGLATGYWVGRDGETEKLVTELMRWIRERRKGQSLGRT